MKGDKEVPVLFQEQDGVWLYIQGKDRGKGKNKKKELKLAISYTGWSLRPSSKKEYVVVDKIYRNIIPSEAIDNIVTKLPLAVFQANKEAKKCKTYKCSSASIQYRDAFVTLGRKAIRDLCGLKIFSDISCN